MLNGRGKTRSMRVILTNTLMKCLLIFKDTNYETKKKSLVSRGLGLVARHMIVIYLLLDDLSLELVISDRESVKKKHMPVV